MLLRLQTRAALQPGARSADIVIMSYEALRGDVAWATAQPWLYAVLDEGHTIRNSKSKTAQVRKHRKVDVAPVESVLAPVPWRIVAVCSAGRGQHHLQLQVQ